MNTTFDYLFCVDPPWIYVGIGETEQAKWIPSYFYSRPGSNICVRRLRGKKMQTVRAMMDEFSAALQFFAGFGENWHALEECLEYMDEWLPAEGYILVIDDAEKLLYEEHPSQMSALLKTLHLVGEWWAKPIVDNGQFNRPKLPFHVLLIVSQPFAMNAERIIKVAQEMNIPIRE